MDIQDTYAPKVVKETDTLIIYAEYNRRGGCVEYKIVKKEKI